MADPFNGELVQGDAVRVDTSGALIDNQTVQKTGTQYSTAVSVQVKRELRDVQNRFLQECDLAGESFYYSWRAGGDVIEGPSIGMAMALVRSFGNCACEVSKIEETDKSFIYYGTFIDLETGSTVTRPFRQSKKSVVAGKLDAERKDDIRFQIGASKCIRNVVLNALPKWLVDKGLEIAKAGVRNRIQTYIDKNGLAKAIQVLVMQLAGNGVLEEDICAKCKIADVKGLDVDQIVQLRGDLNSIQTGQEFAENLFPTIKEREKKTSNLPTEDVEVEKSMGALFNEESPKAPEKPPEQPTSLSGGWHEDKKFEALPANLRDEMLTSKTYKAIDDAATGYIIVLEEASEDVDEVAPVISAVMEFATKAKQQLKENKAAAKQ